MNRPAVLCIVTAIVLRPAAPQEPAFRTSTRLVQINVVVHDKNGPVTNLTRDNFTLTDRGKLQKITVFSVESVLAPGEGQALPEDTFSNSRWRGASTTNAVTIILLDRLNTLNSSAALPYENSAAWIEDHAVANAKQQVLKFVEELNPKDSVALYSLGNSLSVLCDFTNDREELKSVLSRYRAMSLTTHEEVEPGATHTPVPGDFNAHVDRERRNMASMRNADRTAITMTALMEIAAHAANIPGRKNLVWLTANLPFRGVEIARVIGRANIAIYPVDARGLLPHALPTVEDPSSYIASLRAGSEQGSEPEGISTMQELADETGGRAFFNTNDLSSAIHKAVEDAAVSYTLGFYADSHSLDGKFHELKVHVNRSGMDVRYPKGYFALPDMFAVGKERRFETALNSPLESAAIPLLARVEKVNQPKVNSLRVTGSVDIHNVQLAESGELRKGAIEIYIFQQDVHGRMLDKSQDKLSLQLTSENYLAYLKSGVLFREYVQPKDGLATLRILVGDSNSGTVGSLIIPAAQIK